MGNRLREVSRFRVYQASSNALTAIRRLPPSRVASSTVRGSTKPLDSLADRFQQVGERFRDGAVALGEP